MTLPRFSSPLSYCRRPRAVRLGVLLVVAFCQMPLPVGHDHDIASDQAIAGGKAVEAMQRHLALFHSGRVTPTGWHVHLVPAPFWLGGAADDSTGAPAPESEGASGAPLPAIVTADGFAPAYSSHETSIVAILISGNQRGFTAPIVDPLMFGSASDRIVRLGAMLC